MVSDRLGRTNKRRKGRTGAVDMLQKMTDRNAGKPKRENGVKENNFRDICASF